jgi:hypothetical protein
MGGNFHSKANLSLRKSCSFAAAFSPWKKKCPPREEAGKSREE